MGLYRWTAASKSGAIAKLCFLRDAVVWCVSSLSLEGIRGFDYHGLFRHFVCRFHPIIAFLVPATYIYISMR